MNNDKCCPPNVNFIVNRLNNLEKEVDDIQEEIDNLQSFPYNGIVDVYSDLPVVDAIENQVWIVENSQGTPYIEPPLGDYYPKGHYLATSLGWLYLGVFPRQATQAETDAGTLDDVFVSPLTLNNWSGSSGGSVTSVDATTSLSGLSFTGGPITTSGVLSLSGVLDISSGGTGLNTIGTSNQFLSVNPLGAALEYKSLVAGTGIGIAHLAGSTTISNTGVISIDVSGGTTGLSFTGGPVTSTGTITTSGTLNILSGGTGATTANSALNNLLPSQTGNGGKVLQTNGTNTSWQSVGNVSGTGLANQVTFWTGANTQSGSNNFTWNNSTNELFVNGRVGLGAAPVPYLGLKNSLDITGDPSSAGYGMDATIKSDVTADAYGYLSNPSTQAATFTLVNLKHFASVSLGLGAGSTVTNQYGFYVDANITTAQNNFGFYGNIPAGTGRWNLYMVGTANNYLAGSLGIGTTTPTYKLDVQGTGYFLNRLDLSPNDLFATNIAAKLVVGDNTGILGDTVGDYRHIGEYQYLASADVMRLQIAGHRREAGSDWRGTGYRLQYAVDNSFTTGGASFIEIGSDLAGGGIIALSTGNVERLFVSSGGAIGIGTSTPTSSAKLQIDSTTQGFLPPRMTAAQASSIASPAQALLIFVTSTDVTFTAVGWWGFDGAIWRQIG